MGCKAKPAGAIYQFSISRAACVEDKGMTLPEATGSANAINVQATGDAEGCDYRRDVGGYRSCARCAATAWM
jgi:hypothetical protein